MSNEILIIGPSGVGKTALFASLVQAANVQSFLQRDKNVNISVLPKNERAREIFRQVLDLLRDGVLPFQGTGGIIEYEAIITSSFPKKSFLSRLFALLGWTHEEKSFVQFPDAPGGALFPGDDEEPDPVLMRDYQAKIIEKLRTVKGLIVCIDSSVLNAHSQDENHLRNVALDFTRWLPNVFSTVLENSNETTIGLEKVCFVLTKSDLWAEKHQLADTAEVSVKTRDPYTHAKDILGQMFFHSIRNYFSKNIQVAFSMTSVFGFHKGRAHETLVNDTVKRQSQQTISVEDWQPYNVIEPVLFLTQDNYQGDSLKILNWNELGS